MINPKIPQEKTKIKATGDKIFKIIISERGTILKNMGINFCFRYLGVFFNLKNSKKTHWNKVTVRYEDVQTRLKPRTLRLTEVANCINIMAHPSLTFGVSAMHIQKYKLHKLISKEKSYVKIKSNLSRSLNNGAINSKLRIELNNLEDKIDKERVRSFEFIGVSKNDETAYNAIIQQLKEEQIKNKSNKDFLLNLNRKSEQFDDKQDTYIEKMK